MRLVLFSDLHLDTAFAWAPREVARRRRRALRDALDRILALADEVDADAVLCAGDLYEHDRASPDTAAFLRAAFGDTHRPVILAPGNHDWLGPDSLYEQVDWPGNVHVFSEDHLAPYELDAGLTLWGAAHRAPANTDGFLDGFTVGGGGVHLALFHGSERSALGFEGQGKRPHAPFSAEQVPRAGLAHAFCGHYHRPHAGPYHTYPGNPEPLAFGEDGQRGAVVAEVDGDGTVRRQWRPVAVSAVHDVGVDVTGCASAREVRATVAEAVAGLSGAVRVTVEGELAPDIDLRLHGDLDAEALGVDGDVDAVVVRAGRLRPGYDLDGIAAEETVRGQFVRDVLGGDLPDDERRRVLTVGLRALAGRDDLEVD